MLRLAGRGWVSVCRGVPASQLEQYQRHGSESSPYQDLQDMSLVCVVCVGSDRCLAVAQSGTGWSCGTLGTSA